MTVLQQVRKFAKQAKKLGKKWHIRKNGAIACANGFCTLGAIAWGQTAKGREQQAELRKEYETMMKALQKQHDAFMAKAEKLGYEVYDGVDFQPRVGSSRQSFASGLEFASEFVEDKKNFNGWPRSSEAAGNIEGLDEEVADIIIDANDTRKTDLAQAFGEDSNRYKARVILEEVLCSN